MATGIQTGMKSGSRLATGRSAIGKGPGAGGPLGKVKEFWAGLGKGTKILLTVVVTLVLTGLGGYYVTKSNNAPEPLYSTKLTEGDIKEVAMKLTELGVPHEVDIVDGILVSPKYKAKAQVSLAAHGLPRHPISTPFNTEAGAMQGKTQAEQKAIRQRMLEGELTEALRQVEGVADAYIKLAIPEQTYFRDDSRPMRARVLLKMQPGAELSRQQIGGVVHLVAFSVPELQAENVVVVDTNGVDLTAQLPKGPDQTLSGSGTQHETQLAIESKLRDKVQRQLDRVLGPGKSVAEVTVELDFSQDEVTRKTVGGPGDGGTVVVGKQKKVEKFAKDPNQNSGSNAQQLSSSGGGKSDSNYEHSVESVKVETSQTVSRNVRKGYQIKKKSVSVAVDNLQDDQVSKVAGIVNAAAGIEESRGDLVEVVPMNFYRDSAVPGGFENAPPGGWANQSEAASGLTLRSASVAITAVALVFLGLIVTFLIKSHSVQVNQGKLVLSGTSGATSTDIADLLNEKSGKSNAPPSSNAAGETKVNTTDQLEKLAKERPTKVAEMLKSTWLNG